MDVMSGEGRRDRGEEKKVEEEEDLEVEEEKEEGD